jgi:excisionase family DNA binding protein
MKNCKATVADENCETGARQDGDFMNDRLLTIREVAILTGLEVSSLYHFVSQFRIPVVRLSARCIRFRYSDLLKWIEKHTERTRED